MKVMQLLSSLNHDESERGIWDIAHALIKQGNQSLIVASADPEDELVLKLVRDGSDYHRLPMPKKSWWALWQIPKLKQLIHQYLPDIIHVHSRTPAWVLYWALRNYPKHKKPKIICTFYGFYPFNSYTQALLQADKIISASKSIHSYLNHTLDPDLYDMANVVCIRRGVDVRIYPYRHKPSVHWLHHVFAEFPQLEHKKWLIFPTKIGQEYGQEWLIDIIGNLNQKYPDIHIIIMDEDEQSTQSSQDAVVYEDFRQRLMALNLNDFVSFVGKNPPDLKDWLSSAHIVLALANYPESIGMTALQAIHLGTPVVGWNKGAFADILTALYPSGLVKEHTATALCQVIALQLATGVRPTITHEYEIDTMVQQTLATYHNLYCPPSPRLNQ